MAQQHAAPTSVTIAATEEESFLKRFVQRYWILFAGLAVVLTIWILWTQHRRSSAEEAKLASWQALSAVIEFGDRPDPQSMMPAMTPFTLPEAGQLAAMAEDLADEPSGAWAKALEIGRRLRDGDEAGALQAAEDLRAQWPEHPLVRMALPLDSDGESRSLVEHLRTRLDEVESWEAAHPDLFANPPLPAGSPTVTLVTSRGEITLGLYADRAPEHTAHFLAQAEAGAYDGTKFHRVEPDRALYAGDPNSVEGDVATWGQGGDETTLPREKSGLHHFAHVLGMERAVGSLESSGRRFYITLADQLTRDGQYTAFGTVVGGEDVLEAISSGPLDGGRPQDPVVIESTRVQR